MAPRARSSTFNAISANNCCSIWRRCEFELRAWVQAGQKYGETHAHYDLNHSDFKYTYTVQMHHPFEIELIILNCKYWDRVIILMRFCEQNHHTAKEGRAWKAGFERKTINAAQLAATDVKS